VSASSDKTVRVWDVRTRATIAVIEGTQPMWSAAFSADGERLVTASEDRSARIWRVFPTMQALVDQARGAVPRCLTAEQRRQAFLEPEPPAWCAVEKKWPDHAARQVSTSGSVRPHTSFDLQPAHLQTKGPWTKGP
jgi:hypothetical protein